ncbi:MAG TPA: response regulator transcription factor [Pyrinomonadaceae bacterium]|nr:response regulator transcription factor [Pyrinomonadaceae bacterium]
MKKTLARIRILIADGLEVVRRGLRDLLQAKANWEICGEASTGHEAVEMAGRLKPDIAVLDLSMPDLNGPEVARQILKSGSETKVLIFTMHDSRQAVEEMLRIGAHGYVLKSDAARCVVAAVEALIQGHTFLSPQIAEMMIRPCPAEKGGMGELRAGLTSRETEVVRLLAGGKKNKQIAFIMGISVRTVEAHRSRVMNKLGVHTPGELIRHLIRTRVIEP